jgi:hypothetical protein
MLCSVHLLLSLALAVPPGTIQASAERQESTEITGAIAQLWSDSESDRDWAMATLLALGTAAVPRLMDLVSELGDKGRPGVVYPCFSHDQSACDLQVQREPRVRSDAIVLLGRLRAVEAVPLLIKMLRLGDSPTFGVKYTGPEIEALVEIGKPAVPQLLRALERADRVRSSTEGPRSSVSLVLEERLADVTAEIGDSSALPLLERLRIKEHNEMLIGYLDEAIAEITKRANR